jgi:flagellar assembly factor FliW
VEKNNCTDVENGGLRGVMVSFPWGMPGLAYERYLLATLKEDSPFYFLQSIDEPQVGLLLISPFVIRPDYEFDLDDEITELLNLNNKNQVAVFCTVNTSNGLATATVNLLAPIIINNDRCVAKQKILVDQRYSLKEPLILTGRENKEAVGEGR